MPDDSPKTVIEREGQPFVDEPIYVQPKREGPIEISVRVAFGRKLHRSALVVGHNRVALRWLKPNGKRRQ